SGYLGFVETPIEIARFMVSLSSKIDKKSKVLEPGAGRGVFIRALLESDFEDIYAIEYSESLYTYLTNAGFSETIKIIKHDFLQWETDEKFDLIIGNPPYVHYNQLTLELKDSLRKILNSSESNIYYAFIMKAIDLLKEGGELIFIVPYAFLYNTHAKILRKHIIEKGSIEMIIDLDEARIFKGESPETIIFKFVKNKKIEYVNYLKLNKRSKVKIYEIVECASLAIKSMTDNELFSYKKIPHWTHFDRWGITNNTNFLYNDENSFVRLDKIAKVGVGLITGFDEAYLVQDINEIPENERNFLQPFVKSRDCVNDRIESFHWYIFIGDNITEDVLMKEAPFIYNRLLQYKERLEKRYINKQNKQWFHWQALRNYSFLIRNKNKPRIYVPTITRRKPVFSLDENGYLPSGDVLFIQPYNEKDVVRLHCYLNSKEFEEYYLSQGVRLGGRFVFTQRFLSEVYVKVNHTIL
ncbi:MAG: N-6 DNA methylase, partial [Candidatus Aenigmatarchaeota archaeon]